MSSGKDYMTMTEDELTEHMDEALTCCQLAWIKFGERHLGCDL